jgi:hypothetical protein
MCHVDDLSRVLGSPSRRPTALPGGTALPSLGTKLSVRWPFGVWPAVLCAKSLRRSGEVALYGPLYSLLGAAYQRLAAMYERNRQPKPQAFVES